MKESNQYTADIKKLLAEKNAILLAHYYQDAVIQDIADYVGDSLKLAKDAAKTNADLIVFAGVHFMAETVKAINPKKKVIVPDLNASCSLAESCTPEAFKEFLKSYPDHKVVTYINSSLKVKGMSDVICTSANAEKVIEGMPKGEKIVFAPDKNLGKYLIQKTGRDMVLWDGACVVHEAFELEKILKLVKKHPDAKIIAHPESETSILELSSFVGSTSALLKYVQEDSATTYIVATEAGILHKMRLAQPGKEFIPAPIAEDNSCACSECAYMKMNTLEKLYRCIVDESPEIFVDSLEREMALRPIEKMLEIA